MKTPSHPADFALAVHTGRGGMYRSKVLLARADFNGTLELLSAAWEKLLGYGRREFMGKTLGQLAGPDQPAAVAAILDHENMAPVELTLRCRDGKPKRLRLHRRFDGDERKVFIVAEETQEAERRQPISTAAG
jgi:PAS domain-containing protein